MFTFFNLTHLAPYYDTVFVAVCCSALQCVAVSCFALQCVAVSCSVLHNVCFLCSVLQRDTVRYRVWYTMLQYVAARCSVLQCVAPVNISSRAAAQHSSTNRPHSLSTARSINVMSRQIISGTFSACVPDMTQCVAVCVAMCCSVLQCVAVCCSVWCSVCCSECCSVSTSCRAILSAARPVLASLI